MTARGPRPLGYPAPLYGVYWGVVTQIQDSEGKLGRVKVKLPWLDRGDQDQTAWAQVATPMAGDGYGWYTLPDVDDEVAVMFIGGDVDHPVVLGGTWSKSDTAPETNEDGKNNFRGYRSRSGARLILDDSSQGKVVLADKDGKNVAAVGSFSSDGSGANKTAPFKPAMAGSGGATISAMDGKLEINCAQGTFKVTAQNVKINAASAVDVKGGSQLEVKASAALKASAGGAHSLTGSTTSIG